MVRGTAPLRLTWRVCGFYAIADGGLPSGGRYPLRSYTGFLKVVALCEAFQMPLSAHCGRNCTPISDAQFPGCGMSNFFTTTTASTGFFLRRARNRKKAGYIPIAAGQDTGMALEAADARHYRI
jgi:hypothetical protein